MTKDDVLFGYRLQLCSLAADRGASQACRLMGVHRSTYYRWKAQVDRQALAAAQSDCSFRLEATLLLLPQGCVRAPQYRARHP